MLMGCQQGQSFFDRFSGKTALSAARKMESTNADERRAGINYLVRFDYAKRTPYTTRYKQIAQSDAEPTVRAIAIRALNRARDRSATSVFVSALNDKSDLVRLESAKALANVPDRGAIEPLQKIVLNPNDNKDVRIAAADALRHYHEPNGIRSLVSVLNGKDFGVAWQARKSLRTLTGKDMRYDESRWLALLSGQPKPVG